MKELYSINEDTLFLEGITDNKGKVLTKIYEQDKILKLDDTPTNIIKYGCEYFGSTLEGRQKGSMSLLGIKHKVPVMVEGSMELIFFPMCSPRIRACSWVCFNNILTYKRSGYDTEVLFKNGQKLIINISYGIFENQYMRATKLKMVNTLRKLALIKKIGCKISRIYVII